MRFHLPILNYHRIGYPAEDSRLPELYVPPDEFTWQMAYLNQAGYSSISLDEFLAILYGGENPLKRTVLITFDDGSKSVLDAAYPVLKRYGLTALVFLVTDCMDGESNWTAGKEIRRDPILSWEDIARLKAAGLDFASHTLSHPYLPYMEDDLIRQELQMSRRVLEDKINRPVTALAYPFNCYNRRIMRLVRESGYQCAFSAFQGNRHCVSDCYKLRRVTVLPNLNLRGFKHRLSPMYDWENRVVRGGIDLMRWNFR